MLKLKKIPNLQNLFEKYNALEFISELPDLKVSINQLVHVQLISLAKMFRVPEDIALQNLIAQKK